MPPYGDATAHAHIHIVTSTHTQTSHTPSYVLLYPSKKGCENSKAFQILSQKKHTKVISRVVSSGDGGDGGINKAHVTIYLLVVDFLVCQLLVCKRSCDVSTCVNM